MVVRLTLNQELCRGIQVKMEDFVFYAAQHKIKNPPVRCRCRLMTVDVIILTILGVFDGSISAWWLVD